MLTILAATFIALQVGGPARTVCPVMGGNASKDAGKVIYKGVVYGFCCGGCDKRFIANPEKMIVKPGSDLLGVCAYDPIAMKLVDPSKAAAYTDFSRVRYYFVSEDNKKTFDADPKKHGAAPESEVIEQCVECAEKVTPGKAAAYRDHNNVRYYFCCEECTGDFEKKTDEYASKAKPQKAGAHPLPS